MEPQVIPLLHCKQHDVSAILDTETGKKANSKPTKKMDE
jgi:hypothetical protein